MQIALSVEERERAKKTVAKGRCECRRDIDQQEKLATKEERISKFETTNKKSLRSLLSTRSPLPDTLSLAC